jgi:hypothetical protein
MGKVFDFTVEGPDGSTAEIVASGPRQAIAKVLKKRGIKGVVDDVTHHDRDQPRWRASAYVASACRPTWIYIVR